jgi:hypothetical protein
MGKGGKNAAEDMSAKHAGKQAEAPASPSPAKKSSNPPVYVVGISCMWVGYILSCVMSSTGFAPFAHEAQVRQPSQTFMAALCAPGSPYPRPMPR